jgi:hypothetical protein
VVKLTLCLIELGLGLQVLRMFGGGNVGVAAKSCELNLRLLLQRGDLALVGLKCKACLVVIGFRSNISLNEICLAIVG